MGQFARNGLSGEFSVIFVGLNDKTFFVVCITFLKVDLQITLYSLVNFTSSLLITVVRQPFIEA